MWFNLKNKLTLNSLIWASVNIENTLLVYLCVLERTRFFDLELDIIISLKIEQSNKESELNNNSPWNLRNFQLHKMVRTNYLKVEKIKITKNLL